MSDDGRLARQLSFLLEADRQAILDDADPSRVSG